MSSDINLSIKESSDYINKNKGLTLFVIFIVTIAGAQYFEVLLPPLSIAFLLLSAITLLTVLLFGNNSDLFFFLFFTTLLRIKLPFLVEREFLLISPLLFFVISLIKNYRKVLLIKIHYLNNILILLILLFFCFLAFTALRQLVLPGFLGGPSDGNSGFLSRWHILNVILLSLTFLILFRIEHLFLLLKYFYRFYIYVLIISIIIIIYNLKPFPLFNTFTWSLIIENLESKKMIIAGTASTFLMIYLLAIKKLSYTTLFLFLLCIYGIFISGSRSSFLAFFLILFSNCAIKYKVFGKSLLIIACGSLLFIAFSFSPLVLKVPSQFQRLFIIFPSEFYTGEIKELAKTAGASSSSFRYEMWTLAWKDISENIWLGKGLSKPKADYNFGEGGMVAFHLIPPKVLYHDFMATGSLHNTYMSILYLMGFPALIIFFIILLGVILTLYLKTLFEEHREILIFFLLILLYYLTLSLTGDIYAAYEFYMFLIITLKVMHGSKRLDPSLVERLN